MTAAILTSVHATASKTEATRTEHDCIGELQVPLNAYWGIHTQRAIENFPVSGVPVSRHPELIQAYALVKQACARANVKLGGITTTQGRLIDAACRDIYNGGFNDQFPVDVLQGGAGTSTNMNMNEVVANRALEIGGHKKGDYAFIHPNDTVNKSQSTNDTYPAAVRLSLIFALRTLIRSCDALAMSFLALSHRTEDIVKLGRTQLQDAVPMTFGQEFGAFHTVLANDSRKLNDEIARLAVVNLGGTAIGTGICADARFRGLVTKELRSVSGVSVSAAEDPIAATSDMADFVDTSSNIKRLAVHLGKIANDIRLLTSGPQAGLVEIHIPARQAGSSIMPGKINPVIPECVNQSVFTVMGMDTTVSCAAEAGQLQLNAFEPVIAHSLLDGMRILAHAMDTLRTNCVEGITVNEQVGLARATNSASLATSLNGYVGYEEAVRLAKKALAEGRSVHDVAMDEGVVRKEILDDVLDPLKLTRLGR
ncbi:aspartate ammonia-lyase [Bifidobacterium sp. 82T24]|uniref:aspartate ammonia-lyase n=1 Tax=Bifidobacterium pluvialisilvae TaxID=2834436 RepID=UPI001C59AD7E|nr:aspartate ammonia-lyase [Bifidobacterium pluvialisilvae]MBW3088939.1 aspartate ammonia-lyase [Bifidobacterium pluvialisilvae]